jgi:hypothetical protein
MCHSAAMARRLTAASRRARLRTSNLLLGVSEDSVLRGSFVIVASCLGGFDPSALHEWVARVPDGFRVAVQTGSRSAPRMSFDGTFAG